MTAHTLARVKFQGISGLTKDVYVNDFHVQTAAAFTATDADNVTADLHTFYNDTTGTTAPIFDYMSDRVNRGTNSVAVDFYDVAAGGSPIFTRAFDGRGIGAVSDLPEEVSICLSFKGDYGTLPERGPVVTDLPTSESAIDQGAPATHSGRTRPRATKRGRIYLPPLNVGTLSKTATGVRVSGTVITDITVAASHLKSALAGHNAPWEVWSKRIGIGSLVTSGWVDDAFDTQRRRGPAPNTKTTWS